jgi:DNA-binding Lrp family transcriptional regulator
MKTADKLLHLLKKNGLMSVAMLTEKLSISRQYVHKIINILEEKKLILKQGMPPNVFYAINNEAIITKDIILNFEDEKFLKEHFILIDALGKLLTGADAMKYWCTRQNLPVEKTIKEYIDTRQKYLDFYNQQHLIDGFQKLKTTNGIGSIGVDAFYYLDFYAIERFGKTRLGTLMHYAKQGQNKMLMKIIVDEIRQSVLRLIEEESVLAIVYVPPTIKRTLQIMDFLKKNLNIALPTVKVDKLKTPIVVPQKALSKIFERVANAKNSFYVPAQKKYDTILIIDDAVGSGATINEIALKIKEKNISKKIIGLAITGSYKGFEVISEL